MRGTIFFLGMCVGAIVSLTIAFVMFKLAGATAWSWWLIFTPIWFVFAMFFVAAFLLWLLGG